VAGVTISISPVEPRGSLKKTQTAFITSAFTADERNSETITNVLNDLGLLPMFCDQEEGDSISNYNYYTSD